MKVRTAETSGGEIYLVHGEYGDSPLGQLPRKAFANMALMFLRTHPQDEHTARELTLYEWHNEALAGVWLSGAMPEVGKRWHEMAAEAEFGEITYEYPGDWVIRLKDEAQL